MRKAFSAFTVALFALCVWTIFANVVGDDSAVREQSKALAITTAGCGEKCKMTGMNGDRGMIHHTVTYTFDRIGMIEVSCRRAFVIAGDYECSASKP